MLYSLKAISIDSTGGVIIFEVSKSIISRPSFSGREASKIITRQGSVESFLRYRPPASPERERWRAGLSITAHASLKDSFTNKWYKTLGISLRVQRGHWPRSKGQKGCAGIISFSSLICAFFLGIVLFSKALLYDKV
jgi:hypothetical protein